MPVTRLVAEVKRCPSCGIILAPEVVYGTVLVCGADSEVELDDGRVVCLKCAVAPGVAITNPAPIG
jgi:hypothetical protein